MDNLRDKTLMYLEGSTKMSCLIIVLFNLLFSQRIYSQNSSDRTADPAGFRETLFVRTDRDIYITGEDVNLKIYKLNGLTESPCDISKVVYLELLDKSNFPLKQIKIKTDGFSGSSVFTIPDNISSGNYIIRAYSNWMKNFPSDQFFYRIISVINPFESPDHLKIPANIKTAPQKTIADGTVALNITDDENKTITGKTIKKENQIRYVISPVKHSYSSREKVDLNIQATDLSGNPVESEISVSVAKSCVVNSDMNSDFFIINNGNQKTNPGGNNNLAELEGHLISGFMKLKSTDEPLARTDVSLSYVGKTARCEFAKTDENGEFYFIIHEAGMNEIVIQPMSPDITGYYIELNQPFSSSFSKFKAGTFYLDSSRIDEINKVIIGMQVNNVYQPFRPQSSEEVQITIPDFYGKPENTIKMSDYIELTSLREIVKEIIPNVYTQKQNGKYDFKLINKFRGQPFENKPLVLVDGIPVYDFEKVLSISSKDIERADVINTRYFYSENVFDGILSFVTRKGDMGVMEFDNSIFRQAYEGCRVKKAFYSPDYSRDEFRNNHIADYRNTLYWNPDLVTGKDGKTVAEFYTSDESSGYTIVVEGITKDGRTGYSSAILTVK
jgi:hypothetical protein